MSTTDLGALATANNMGSTSIPDLHLTGTIYDEKTDIRLVSSPHSLPFQFDSSLEDTTFEPSTFDKFTLAYPFFKPWFTSIDFATKNKTLITTLSKDITFRPTGSVEITADQTIEIIPVQLELNDAGCDDQIQALVERFKQFGAYPS